MSDPDKNKKDKNVALVFETACDAHWMKDVVQLPNALAQSIFQKDAILITRPNHKQSKLCEKISLVYLGTDNPNNYQNFETQNFMNLVTDANWHFVACKKAADIASILILYPFYGDAYKGAKWFKIKRWLKLKKGIVILKTDGTLREQAGFKTSLRLKLQDFKRYFFIDKIICENEQLYLELKINHPHLNSKLVHLPNCPLDIYHSQDLIPYSIRSLNILFVGRPDDKEKGLDVLLDAWLNIFHKIPGWTLQIVGTFSIKFKNEWDGRIEIKNAMNTVKWIGEINPENLINVYNNAKIVACPSRKESGPIVLSEAILSGCSFIGTNVGEIPSVLNGLSGLITKENPIESQLLFFTQNPIQCIEQSRKLLERMKDRKWAIQVKKLKI